MDPITARRLRLKHTASAAESAAASLENLRTNAAILLGPSPFGDVDNTDRVEAFGKPLAGELGEITSRIREIYADLDHLALAEDIDGPVFADCHHRLAHRGAEPIREVAAAA